MAYRFERVHPEASTHRRVRQPPVRAKSHNRALHEAAVGRVSAVLSDRFAWFLSPVRIKAIAEDLRVLRRQRDLDLGIVVVSVILSAFSRSSDVEGRVRDAFAIYREIDSTIDVVDEAFRKAMKRSADVLLHLLQERTRELEKLAGRPPLRGRLSFFKDLVSTDATSFKLARALAAGLPARLQGCHRRSRCGADVCSERAELPVGADQHGSTRRRMALDAPLTFQELRGDGENVGRVRIGGVRSTSRG